MFRRKYIFDKETLTYAHETKERKQQFRKAIFYLSIALVFAIIGNLALNYFELHPKYNSLSFEKTELEKKCLALRDSLADIEDIIAIIQKKDDELYRPLFELGPMPMSIREAGYGGSKADEDLEHLINSDVFFDTKNQFTKIEKQIIIERNSLQRLIVLANEMKNFNQCMPAIMPISPDEKYYVSSGYGYRIDPYSKRRTSHHGVDFAAHVGVPIYATGDGTVKRTKTHRWGYGKELMIDHGYGYQTIYAHLYKFIVKPGDKVKRGQLIGLMGNTGKSTGPHLHYEIRLNKATVNPANYYDKELPIIEYKEIISNASKTIISE